MKTFKSAFCWKLFNVNIVARISHLPHKFSAKKKKQRISGNSRLAESHLKYWRWVSVKKTVKDRRMLGRLKSSCTTLLFGFYQIRVSVALNTSWRLAYPRADTGLLLRPRDKISDSNKWKYKLLLKCAFTFKYTVLNPSWRVADPLTDTDLRALSNLTNFQGQL